MHLWDIFSHILFSAIVLIRSDEDNWRGCWSNNIVPYKIENGFSNSERNLIRLRIGILHNITCVRWVEENDVHGAVNRVHFQKTEAHSCHTEIARYLDGTLKPFYIIYIRFNDECVGRRQRSIMHEMLHALGFRHEHQRTDRDCYVIVDEEVKEHRNYKINPLSSWMDHFPYDKYSVMHYPRSHKLKARSERMFDFWEPLGNAEGELTLLDVWKLLYKFCNFPHYCEITPFSCDFVDEVEKGCKYAVINNVSF